jgi:hypothetical protein
VEGMSEMGKMVIYFEKLTLGELACRTFERINRLAMA